MNLKTNVVMREWYVLVRFKKYPDSKCLIRIVAETKDAMLLKMPEQYEFIQVTDIKDLVDTE